MKPFQGPTLIAGKKLGVGKKFKVLDFQSSLLVSLKGNAQFIKGKNVKDLFEPSIGSILP